MADNDKYAVVNDPKYVFAGNRLGRGQVVKLTDAQLKATQDHKPPRLVETAAPESDDGVVDIRPKVRPAQRWTSFIARVFRIEDGKMGRIEAVLEGVPYGMLSGWSTWEEGMSDRARDVTR